MRKNYPNLLIVYGNGRNIGKTSLACKIIKEISKVTEIIAIKISPHFHKIKDSRNIFKSETCNVFLEIKRNNNNKDSTRMLNAGAKMVYYIQCNDQSINRVEEYVLAKINKNIPIICESSGLLNIIEPGLSIFIEGEQVIINKKPCKESLVVKSINDIPRINAKSICYKNGKWFV